MKKEFDIKKFATEFGGDIEIHVHGCTPQKVDEISKKLGQEGEYWEWEEVSGVRFHIGDIEINAYFE